MRRVLLFLPLALVVGCPPPAPAQYHWVPLPSNRDQEALYWQSTQVGTWSHTAGKYYPFDGAAWGPACEPPLAPPLRNFGVVRGRLAARERITVNGQPVTAEQAHKRLFEEQFKEGDKSLPDDRGKPFWVVVGSVEQCAAAHKLLEAPPFKDVGRIQCYRPDDAMIKDRDGKTMYLPGVILVSADGKVIGHTDSFDQVEDFHEGLRRLTPDYDPQNVSSLKDRALLPSLLSAAPHALIGAAGAGLFLTLLIVHSLRSKK